MQVAHEISQAGLACVWSLRRDALLLLAAEPDRADWLLRHHVRRIRGILVVWLSKGSEHVHGRMAQVSELALDSLSTRCVVCLPRRSRRGSNGWLTHWQSAFAKIAAAAGGLVSS